MIKMTLIESVLIMVGCTVAVATAAAVPVNDDGVVSGSCKLLSIVPYSDQSVYTTRDVQRNNATESYGLLKRWTAQTIGLTGYTYTAAILMAMDHFNSRDASIVPELAHLPSDCDNVYFSDDSIVADGALNNIISGQIVLNATQDPNLCAVLGPYGFIPASWTTPITNSLNVPQIFYSMALTDVTEQDLYPTSVRTSLIPYDHASKLLSWLQRNGRTHLGVIHGDSDYDREYASVLSQYGEMYGVNTTIFSLIAPLPGRNRTLHAAQMYNDVEASGIRTLLRLFSTVGPQELVKLSNTARRHGLLPSRGYLWILDDHITPVDDLPQILSRNLTVAPAGSAIDRLLSGAIVVSPAASWEGNGNSDSRFVQSWKSMNSSFVERVNALVPLTPDHVEYIQGPPDFFQTTMPRRGAELVYDSVMAIGIGACTAAATAANRTNHSDIQTAGEIEAIRNGTTADNVTTAEAAAGTNASSALSAVTSNNNITGPPPSRRHFRRYLQDGPPPSEGGGGGQQRPEPASTTPSLAHDNAHVQGIIQSVFTGASGRVAFGKLGSRYKDRVPEDVSYGAYQIRSTSPDVTTKQYQVVMVERSTPTGVWEPVNGESFAYVVGGSPTDPFGPPRVAVVPNYLPQWARALGLMLMTVAWVISLMMNWAVWKWQDKPHIRAGQPIYLYVLCLGSFLTSSAILPLSFDENTGSTAAQLDAACTVTPWLFFIGINSMFTGLFCKLWRIEKVTQFRRQQVKVIQTVWPLILLLTSTVVCLIAWTVRDPWTWKRVDINESPYETFGQCRSDHFALYFSLLSIIMIVATGLAFVMAWKTKDLNIDSRFSDANAVFLAIASQLQAWFLGLPVLAVLGDASAEATYLGRVLLIWLFAMASLWIVVMPKIWRTWHEMRNPASTARTSRVFVSGLTNPGNSHNIVASHSPTTTPTGETTTSPASGALSRISKESERMEM